MYLKTEGLVLRVSPFQEADAMLSVLTRGHGLLSVRARGCGGQKARSRARASFWRIRSLRCLKTAAFTRSMRHRLWRCSCRCVTTLKG